MPPVVRFYPNPHHVHISRAVSQMLDRIAQVGNLDTGFIICYISEITPNWSVLTGNWSLVCSGRFRVVSMSGFTYRIRLLSTNSCVFESFPYVLDTRMLSKAEPSSFAGVRSSTGTPFASYASPTIAQRLGVLRQRLDLVPPRLLAQPPRHAPDPGPFQPLTHASLNVRVRGGQERSTSEGTENLFAPVPPLGSL